MSFTIEPRWLPYGVFKTDVNLQESCLFLSINIHYHLSDSICAAINENRYMCFFLQINKHSCLKITFMLIICGKFIVKHTFWPRNEVIFQQILPVKRVFQHIQTRHAFPSSVTFTQMSSAYRLEFVVRKSLHSQIFPLDAFYDFYIIASFDRDWGAVYNIRVLNVSCNITVCINEFYVIKFSVGVRCRTDFVTYFYFKRLQKYIWK